MRHRALRIITGITLAVLLGMNSVFLQSVAWLSMTVSYSQQVPVSTAVSWTFDGQHPCQICRLAKKAASDEHKDQAAPLSVKIEAVAPIAGEIYVPQTCRPEARFAEVALPQPRSQRPSLPPPRAFRA